VQLSREELIRAYRGMVTIRRFEERVQEEFSKGGIPGFVHLYAGEEASAIGMCLHLGPKDYIASTHRGHGHSIAKGCDIVGMMHELFGRQGGLCGGKGGSMHIADLDQGMLGANGIVGGGPPLVVGAALTAKTLGTGTVAVKVNGDDFFEVHEAAREAIERARAGGGPSAIEVDTCRFYGHHSGDAQLYRGKDEVKRLREERDCIKNFRRRVAEAALLETDALDAVDAEIADLIERAVASAQAAPPPPESELLTDVYVSY